jgi:transposase
MNTSSACPEQLLHENALLKQEIAYLKEQVEWFRRQIFGKRSDKIVEPPADNVIFLPGFEEPSRPVAEPRNRVVAAHERKVPSRNGQDAIALPADLPVERQVIDLPEKEKVCVETGLPLTKIGEEVTKKIAYRPGNYFIKEIVRLKYVLPQESSGGIRIAPLPESLLDRCQADESLLADIMVRKYADHLPLYRIAEIFARDGIGISRQTLCKWILRAGHALKPLYDEMKKHVLASSNVFVDETPLKMLEGSHGKAQQAFMWMIAGGQEANPSYRIYAFRTNRSHMHAETLLKDYKGILHSDKYGAYEKMAQKKQIVWCPCWAHIRRKFVEAEAGDPRFRDWVLRKIRYLFMFEKVAWSRSPEERIRIRREKESRIIDELIQAVQNRLIKGSPLPKSKFREALGYFCGLTPYLKNYIDAPYTRLDNNIAERALRPIALGRKNWLFVGNEQSGEAAATILSLVQTCRALDINPREYLDDVMRRLMSHPAKKLHELLPNEWALSKNPRS